MNHLLFKIAHRQGRNLIKTLSYPSAPLNVSLDLAQQTGIAKPHIATNHPRETLITTLDNGLRVASQESFGQYCTVGVFVDAGSRNEKGYPAGVSHLLSKLGFMSSSKYNHIDIELEKIGGVPEVKAFRDLMFYSLSCFSFALPQAMEILADVFWRPKLTAEELEGGRYAVDAEFNDTISKPVPETFLMELAHQASYRNNTLGLPALCLPETASNIKLSDINRFLSSFFVPSRLVVVGVNVDHSKLVDLVRRHFVNYSSTWERTADTRTVDTEAAEYTGGAMVKVPRESAPVVGPNRLPDLTHVAVSLESSSYTDEDFFAYAVLNSLMGGGGSFSAGGPGKGMYTQLYLRVLNKHHWVYHAQAMNHAYSDSGIFCLFGSSHPKQSRGLVDVLCKEFHNMADGFNNVSIERAKKMLQSALLMNLESRAINFEDIGRQVLGHNKRFTAKELCDKIDLVTPGDLKRLGQKMCTNTLPSVAALGDLSYLPDMEEINHAFESKQSLVKRSTRSIFF